MIPHNNKNNNTERTFFPGRAPTMTFRLLLVNRSLRNNASLFHGKYGQATISAFAVIKWATNTTGSGKKPWNNAESISLLLLSFIIYLFSACHTHSRTIWPTFLFQSRSACVHSTRCLHIRCDCDGIRADATTMMIHRTSIYFIFISKANISLPYVQSIACTNTCQLPVCQHGTATTTISYIYLH